MSIDELRDDIKHILGHCISCTKSDCWYLSEKAFSGDMLDDEQELELVRLVKKHELKARLDELENMSGKSMRLYKNYVIRKRIDELKKELEKYG